MDKYKLANDGGVIRLSDNAKIPNDPNNKDWIAYQDFLKKGGVPLPSDPPAIDPMPPIQDQVVAVFRGGSDFELMKMKVLSIIDQVPSKSVPNKG
jgi:hypothetical protein